MSKSELMTRQRFLISSTRLIFGGAAAASFSGLSGCALLESAGDESAAPVDISGQSAVASRIKVATIGAADLAKTEDWYGNWLGYTVAERGVIGADLAHSWGAANMAERPYILMQPAGGADVFIRAALIDEVPDYKAMTTTGWNSFEIAVEDVYALEDELRAGPFEIIGEADSIGGNSPSIHAMQVIGPSREVLYLTAETGDRETSPVPRAQSFVDRVFIVVLAGPDPMAIQDFYSDKLGMAAVGGADFQIPIIARAQGLPEDHLFELKLVAASEPGNLIEIDRYSASIGSRPRAEGQLPPGNAMVSFSVDDLRAVDADWFSAPLTESSLAYEGNRSGALTGPTGEIIELIEEQR